MDEPRKNSGKSLLGPPQASIGRFWDSEDLRVMSHCSTKLTNMNHKMIWDDKNEDDLTIVLRVVDYFSNIICLVIFKKKYMLRRRGGSPDSLIMSYPTDKEASGFDSCSAVIFV